MVATLPFRKHPRGEWIARCTDRLRELIPMFTDAAAYSTAMALYPRSMESVPERVAEHYATGEPALQQRD
jgi:hypothetical protein